MRVADSSALVGFFVAEDAHHRRARAALEDSEPIWVPSEILAETLQLLQRRLGTDAAVRAGEFLWSQPNTEIQPSDTAVLMAAWEEFIGSTRLAFTDCIVIAVCREHDATPLAYDKAILRAVRG